MNNQKLNTAEYTKLVNFIWSIADDCLRDVFVIRLGESFVKDISKHILCASDACRNIE